MVISDAEPWIHMSLCPDNVILARLSGSFAPDSFSALAGHYDDEGVIYLRQRVVNVIQSGCRVVSHLREGFEIPQERITCGKPVGSYSTNLLSLCHPSAA
jgi:hypothetical protein